MARFRPTSKAERLMKIEANVAELSARTEQLAADVANRAPLSEVERLNNAYDILSQVFELLSDRAPASEIERLDRAYQVMADIQQQLHNVNLELSNLKATSGRNRRDLMWESERLNAIIEKAGDAADGAVWVESLSGQLESRFDLLYHRFEDLYRGSREEITKRLGIYEELLDLPKLREVGPAVDLGAGRGEWVEFLTGHGFDAYGVDVNGDMAAAAAQRGLNIEVGDILDHVRTLAPNTIGAISMFHVAEHLDFEALVGVIRSSALALADGGVLIVETPNPTNLQVGSAAFYLDPTHIKPIHPNLLEFVFAESGLTDVTVHYLNRGPQPPLQVPLALKGDEAGEAMIELLNEQLLTPFDYVVIGTQRSQ
jgi:O-antigen chain-terminating methyltransferase